MLTDDKNATVIESPGFPNWLLPSLNCTLRIQAPDNMRVLLTLIDFDLGEAQKTPKLDKCSMTNSNEPADKLLLHLGDDKTIALCGSVDSGRDYHQGQHFMSYNNEITMQMTTRSHTFGSQYIARRGFKFTYAFIAQEGTLTTTLELINKRSDKSQSSSDGHSAIGTITSLNYPYLAPTHVANVIYLKTEVGNSIELRASKLLYSYISEGECSHGQENLLSITDHYGNISLYPPTVRTWSICKKPEDLVFKPEVRIRKSVRDISYTSYSNRLKSIVSTFHVLALRTPPLLSSVSTNRHFMPVFQFFFRTDKDDKFFNKTVSPPVKYPLDSCAYSPCSTNGVCRLKRYSRNETINQCICKVHYTGSFCHLTLCEKRPCGDRGLCKLDKNVNSYICHCNTGYTGKNCRDTLEKCDRQNPCRDRGKCALINGIPTCTCEKWYEAYSFAEPNSAPRYSLTSNGGFSINLTANNSPLPRSRSSIIGKFKKRGFHRGRSGGGHMSDSEVFHSGGRSNEENSDAESSSFDTGKILSRFLGTSFRKPDRRMSLDDFNKLSDHKLRKQRRFLDIEIADCDRRSVTSTLSETSFIAPPLSPMDRTIPTIAEFHVITENSMEDQDSVVSGGKTPPIAQLFARESSTSVDNASLSERLPHVLKQESEAESLLKSIRNIQRVSNIEMSSYSEEEEILRQQSQSQNSNRSCQSPRPRLSRPPSGFSSSSSESQMLCVIPEITITTAAIEYEPEDNQTSPVQQDDIVIEVEEEQEEETDKYEEIPEVSNISEHGMPAHLRRSSVPTPLSDDANRFSNASSMSCDTPIYRVLSSQPRKHSLEHGVPKIIIGTSFGNRGNDNSMKSINVRSDRTISESNLSTSGYSSLSSPGISRCSSSSPIHEEIHSIAIPSQTGEPQLCVPTVTRHSLKSKQKSSYGNFLTIPNISYPMVPHHHSPSQSPKLPKSSGMQSKNDRDYIFNFEQGGSITSQTIGISRRSSQESRDEGIELNDNSVTSPRRLPASPNIGSKRDRLVSMRQAHKSVDVHHEVASRKPPLKSIQNSRSFEGFFEVDRSRIAEYEREILLIKRQMRERSPCISRQPSCPGLLQPPEASPSSDSEVDTVQEKERERQLMLLKRFERRKNGSNSSLNARESSERRSQFRARSRSPLAFSQSIDVASSNGSRTREYQRCSSSRSLSTAIYMDATISSSTSSDSIPSSLNEDEPITIRSAHSCNTINFSTASFSCSPAASGPSSTRQLTQQLSQQSEHKSKKQSKGLKERILLKMRTQSHSLPASPQMADERNIDEHPATAAPSLTLLSQESSVAKSSSSLQRSSSNKDDISCSSSASERTALVKKPNRGKLIKQKDSLDFC